MNEKQIYSVGIDITKACFTKHGELFFFQITLFSFNQV